MSALYGADSVQRRTDMEERTTSLRHRIPAEKRKECLKLFEEGYGYKKTAQLAGTVRDYKRRYASGDNSWADRGGNMVSV